MSLSSVVCCLKGCWIGLVSCCGFGIVLGFCYISDCGFSCKIFKALSITLFSKAFLYVLITSEFFEWADILFFSASDISPVFYAEIVEWRNRCGLKHLFSHSELSIANQFSYLFSIP